MQIHSIKIIRGTNRIKLIYIITNHHNFISICPIAVYVK